MTEYQKDSQILSVLQFLKHNPGTAVSVCYVLLTYCGIVYSAAFYHNFNIPILKTAEVSDLLVAGISEPAALLMFLGGVILTVVVDQMNIYFYDIQARWQARPWSFKRVLVLFFVYVPKKQISVLLFMIGVFILYSGMFVWLYADWKSEQITEGDGHQLQVKVSGEDAIREVTLLGSTIRYLMVYDQKSKEATLINVEQVETIQPAIKNVEAASTDSLMQTEETTEGAN